MVGDRTKSMSIHCGVDVAAILLSTCMGAAAVEVLAPSLTRMAAAADAFFRSRHKFVYFQHQLNKTSPEQLKTNI
jgi:hypothetical protein